MKLFILVLAVHTTFLAKASTNKDYSMSPVYNQFVLDTYIEQNQTAQSENNNTSISESLFNKTYQEKAVQRLNQYYFINATIFLFLFVISLYKITMMAQSIKAKQISYTFFTIYSYNQIILNYLTMSLLSRGDDLMKIEGFAIFTIIAIYIIWAHILILRNRQNILVFDLKMSFVFHAIEIISFLINSSLQKGITIVLFIQSPFIQIFFSWIGTKRRYVKSQVYEFYQITYFRSYFLFSYEMLIIDLCSYENYLKILCLAAVILLLFKRQRKITAAVIPKVQRWIASKRGQVRESITCRICLEQIDGYGIAFRGWSVNELEQFQKRIKNALIETPCGHVYHAKCICPWVKIKAACPIDDLRISQS